MIGSSGNINCKNIFKNLTVFPFAKCGKRSKSLPRKDKTLCLRSDLCQVGTLTACQETT